MQIMLNGERRDIEAATLADALEECGFSGHFATAVNEVFVPAAERPGRALSDGDRIEILGAMQGG